MRFKSNREDIVDALCIKGNQGWELVSILTKLPSDRTKESYIAFFKRRITE